MSEDQNNVEDPSVDEVKEGVQNEGVTPSDSGAGSTAKKSKISLPFILLGILLVGGLCPIPDFDGDGSMDIAGKWIMLQVMRTQEEGKVGGPTAPDFGEIGEKPENPPLVGAGG
ncbi:MAG: hypothetical protein AAF939_17075 [Planctomycetota bacterium]